MTLKSCLASLPVLLALTATAGSTNVLAEETAKVAIVTSTFNNQAPENEANPARIASILKIAVYAAGAQSTTFSQDCSSNFDRSSIDKIIQSKTDVVVGYFCKSVVRSLVAELKNAGIPAIDLNPDNEFPDEIQTIDRDLIYSIDRKPITFDLLISNFIAENWKNSRIAIISNRDDFTHRSVKTITENLAKVGIQPVFASKISFTPESIKNVVQDLLRQNVDKVFISSEPDGVNAFHKISEELGFNPTLAGGSDTVLYLRQQNLPNGFLGVFPPHRKNSDSSPHVLALSFAFDFDPAAEAAGYIAGLAAVRSHSKKLSANEILSKETFNTNLGPIRFNSEHFRSADRTYQIYKWEDGSFDLVE